MGKSVVFGLLGLLGVTTLGGCAGEAAAGAALPTQLGVEATGSNNADFIGPSTPAVIGDDQPSSQYGELEAEFISGSPSSGQVDPTCYDACIEGGFSSDDCVASCSGEDPGNDTCTIDGDLCAGCASCDEQCDCALVGQEELLSACYDSCAATTD